MSFMMRMLPFLTRVEREMVFAIVNGTVYVSPRHRPEIETWTSCGYVYDPYLPAWRTRRVWRWQR